MSSLSQTYSSGSESGAVGAEDNLAHKLVAFVLREFADGLVAKRTRDLIANLLDSDAIEQFIARKERCDVCALMRQSLQNNEAAAAKKQIVFLSGISEGLWANCDRAALLQVFDNLISNAVKYSPPNSTIQVHALLEHDSIVINVRDQGLGINEAGRQKLFDTFARLMAGPANDMFSSGVGLAIAKKLAEALSGSIRWRRTLGSGSTFTLRLPVSAGLEDSLEIPDIKLLARNIIELPRFGWRN